jgi:hypothetical protein
VAIASLAYLIEGMEQRHLHADANYRTIRRSDETFGVEVTIPESYRLKQQGFSFCLRVVSEWASRRRQAEKADGALSRTPSARTIARFMTIGRDGLSKAETSNVMLGEQERARGACNAQVASPRVLCSPRIILDHGKRVIRLIRS